MGAGYDWCTTLCGAHLSIWPLPLVPDPFGERIEHDGTSGLRVLIHNSDSPKNRGDRAILVGLIELVRNRWPEAEIWSLSQYPERDEEWFGIRFLPQSPYSTNLGQWLALYRLARRSDIVFWGGGEILKDYTNKLGLVYWWVKLTFLSVANPRIVGAFQGIGPTSATISKRLIRATVNRTKVFLTRDEESKAKLVAWGVKRPIISSFDPAVVGVPSVFDDALAARVAAAGIEPEFLRNAVGFGLRRWFHYSQSGWIPNKYRRQATTVVAESDDLVAYRRHVAELADGLVERNDVNLVFFPMHMDASEGDAEFAEEVIALMRNGNRTRVLADDVFSSNDYAGIMSALRMFVASRLHSAILATIATVPAFVLYYVDKGRLFFEQVGMQRFSEPIEATLPENSPALLGARLDALLADPESVRAEQRAGVASMSAALERDFAAAVALVPPRGEKR
jgi:polysaccharide pyruvyl transferase WcaK-like protein